MPDLKKPKSELSRNQHRAMEHMLTNRGDVDKDELAIDINERERNQLIQWGYIRSMYNGRFQATPEAKQAFGYKR